ncbi:MAG: hypothetical protein VX910_04665 [Candidatus Latescibacterota bacterium]|nr:hypothetical protein [Candidatus Latescibacterota bacterium]
MTAQSWILLLVAITVGVACSESDLRQVKPERTRDADGIIKLYRNKKQGDWMLKGKVILVTSAIITELGNKGRTAIVTGRKSLSPIPIVISFSQHEKLGKGLLSGDNVTFKGLCVGMDQAIRFDSCILISTTRQTLGNS